MQQIFKIYKEVTRPVRGIGRSEYDIGGCPLAISHEIGSHSPSGGDPVEAADRLAVMTVVTRFRKSSRIRSTMVPKCFFIWWVHLEA